MDFSWLKTVAPTIATALGGPLAGLAVEAVGKAFGMSEATTEKVEQALTAGQLTGEQLLALKQAELELKKSEEELGFKFADLEVQDRRDARAMEVATRSPMPALLTILITLGFFGILVGMLAGHLQADSNPVMLMMLGALGSGWTASLAFWLGTTHGSAQKTEILARTQPLN